MRLLLLPALALALPGCLAKTALDVATLPVKVASRAVDVATVSQAESDQKRGARLRKREECLGREERLARKQQREPDTGKCGEKD
jgi:hypothetical protein